MKIFFRIVLATFVVLAVSSCATIIKGGSQDVSVQSDPSGATVVIYDSANQEVWSSTTPTTVELDRGDGFFRAATYRVDVSLDGYETSTVEITGSINGWYAAGNLVLGGLIGWLIVDPLTGAMYNLRPENIDVGLSRAVGFDETGDSLALAVVLLPDLPAIARDSLELITPAKAN